MRREDKHGDGDGDAQLKRGHGSSVHVCVELFTLDLIKRASFSLHAAKEWWCLEGAIFAHHLPG